VAIKTQPTNQSVRAFLDAIDDPAKRADCKRIASLMRSVTGKQARMWGDAIVGYDSYTYRYASGHTGTWPMAAFSPRKRNITVYFDSFEHDPELLERLGPHTLSKSCLYLKSLAGVDLDVLDELVRRSYRRVQALYPEH
jgi:hypothetical protein